MTREELKTNFRKNVIGACIFSGGAGVNALGFAYAATNPEIPSLVSGTIHSGSGCIVFGVGGALTVRAAVAMYRRATNYVDRLAALGNRDAELERPADKVAPAAAPSQRHG